MSCKGGQKSRVIPFCGTVMLATALFSSLSVQAEEMSHERMIEVIRKTARTMSPRGVHLVAALPLADTEAALLDEALGGAAPA